MSRKYLSNGYLVTARWNFESVLALPLCIAWPRLLRSSSRCRMLRSSGCPSISPLFKVLNTSTCPQACRGSQSARPRQCERPPLREPPFLRQIIDAIDVKKSSVGHSYAFAQKNHAILQGSAALLGATRVLIPVRLASADRLGNV